jgi:hypothetical protein
LHGAAELGIHERLPDGVVAVVAERLDGELVVAPFAGTLAERTRRRKLRHAVHCSHP